MKIKIPSLERLDTGGCSSFIKNLEKSVKMFSHQLVADGDYDILLIAGATLCDRATVKQAKESGKKIILRVDNILEDGKNRNTGMPRLREFAKDCDVVVYQSDWAQKLLKSYCGDGIIIKNGVDTDIFFPRKEKKDWNNIRVFYSKFSRGEGKNFNVVQYFWREYNLEKKDDTLVLVGRFADDKIKINNPFEFHNNENYEYNGVIQDFNKLAEIMRHCDVALLPYAYDACSNTILEAQACGLSVIYQDNGGTPEIIESGIKIGTYSPIIDVQSALSQKINFEEFKDKFGLREMGEKYDGLFRFLTQVKIHEI